MAIVGSTISSVLGHGVNSYITRNVLKQVQKCAIVSLCDLSMTYLNDEHRWSIISFDDPLHQENIRLEEMIDCLFEPMKTPRVLTQNN